MANLGNRKTFPAGFPLYLTAGIIIGGVIGYGIGGTCVNHLPAGETCLGATEAEVEALRSRSRADDALEAGFEPTRNAPQQVSASHTARYLKSLESGTLVGRCEAPIYELFINDNDPSFCRCDSSKACAMRQLIEKRSFKSRGVTDEVYLSENIRCQECHRTVPVGIEVITVQKAGENRKVIKHCYYCRAHGEYHD